MQRGFLEEDEGTETEETGRLSGPQRGFVQVPGKAVGLTPEWGSLTPTLAGGAWWTDGGQEDEVWGEGAEGEESLGDRGGVSR